MKLANTSYKLFFVFLYFFAVIFTAPAALAESPQPSEKIQKAISYMRPSTSICPERVWPQNVWNKAAFVFTEPQSKDSISWFWDLQSNQLRPIDNSKLSAGALTSYYSFFELEGYSVTSLNMDRLWFPEQVAAFGIHEAFHYLAQAKWSSPKVRSRSTAYPIDPFPRLFRKLTQDQILKYTQSQDIAHLEEAKYWFEKWKTSAPDEVGNYTDGIEGSANYIETMAMSVSRQGCQASEVDLVKEALARVNQRTLHSQPTLDAFDTESYTMGATAILAARQAGLFNLEWAVKMSQGESPIEMLFDSLKISKMNYPRPLGARFIQKAIASSAQFKVLVDPQIKDFKNKDIVRVEVPWHWLTGSYNVRAFLYAKSIQRDIKVMSKINFENGQGSHFSMDDGAVNIQDENLKGCAQRGFILASKSDIQILNNNEFKVQTKYVNAKFKGQFITEQGMTYLCNTEK